MTQEPNHVAGKMISDLLDYWKTQQTINHKEISQAEQALVEECFKIAERLKRESIIENVDVIQPYYKDKNFSLLAKSIRENIQNNEPEVALDRLHTFVVRYTRRLCNKHKISYDKDKPLHSLFGEYIKYLKQKDFIESEMTQRILKSSISILESFNDVRNNKSFAHDNPILNYNESVLIVNNILSAIRFIEAFEKENLEKNEQDDVQAELDNFSF